MRTGTVCITVDVEEWFQAENLRDSHPPRSWDSRESRVEASTHRILSVLEERSVPATFFILGWVADRIPALVRTIAGAGHEIASHGQNHIRCCSLEETRLREDISASKKTLEDICGAPVIGYRAPCFSVSDRLLDLLFEEGYRYDSSLNPFLAHDRYGRLGTPGRLREPFTHRSGIVEFPMPTCRFMGLELPVSGGGYFRLYPYWFFGRMVLKCLRETGLYVFYMHPWEVDPDQPRTRVRNPGHMFRHYYGLRGTLTKLARLVAIPGEKRRLRDILP